ncbi:MAG: hypothetical protein EA351_04635 [Gemmatimonadales bacterium]|nr:MAG: hypothetical protein EA351_04635 [Gemmatimonadales bacterium]
MGNFNGLRSTRGPRLPWFSTIQKGMLMRTLKMLAATLLFGMVLAAPAAAQQAGEAPGPVILDRSAVEAAVLGHTSKAELQRGQLGDFLATPEVREVAEDRGLDLSRIEAAASTLSDEEVSAVHPLVEKASEAMQQRNTITISVYTIIIFLLLLILLT